MSPSVALYSFATSLLPPVTLAVFLLGLAYNAASWRGLGRHRGVYRADPLRLAKDFVANVVFLGRMARSSKLLWVAAMLMHVSVFLILFGHLRGFGVWSKELIGWMGPGAVEFFMHALPTALGLVFTACAAALLARRVVAGRRWGLSTLEDYGVLVLLLLIGITGSAMRLAEHKPEAFVVEFLPGVTFRYEETPPLLWAGAHFLLVQLFIMYIPLSKLFHMVFTPISVVIGSSLEHSVITEKSLGPSKKQVLDLYGCTSCGICAEACQVRKATEGAYKSYYTLARALRSYMLRERASRFLPFLRPGASTILKKISDDAFLCLLCGRCAKFCPAMVDTVSLGISIREMLVSKGIVPENLKLVADMSKEVKNVLGLPNEDRAMWTEYSPAPPPTGEKGVDVVYFVGCMASFSPAVQDIPVAVSQILDAAGVKYTILGSDEWCCGYPLILAGMKDLAAEFIKHNLEKVREVGAKTVIFSCPSCFLTWRTEYNVDGLELLHHTQFILRLIKEGRLRLGPVRLKVAYHDPCDLGRKSKIYDEPREVIKSIPGVELVELPHSREESLCCGGGGDVEIVDEDFPGRVGAEVLIEARKAGAEALVTACQQCKRTFSKAAKRVKEPVRLLDIAELVLMSLESSQ